MFAKLYRFLTNKINNKTADSMTIKLPNVYLRDIQILPMDNKTNITEEIREAIYNIFDKYIIVNNFSDYNYYYIKISTRKITNIPLIEAHEIYTDSAFHRAEILPNLPHQKGNPLCPGGLLVVGLECINKYTPNMGSYWGYEGYYLSLIVDIKQYSIWDARGVKAS